MEAKYYQTGGQYVNIKRSSLSSAKPENHQITPPLISMIWQFFLHCNTYKLVQLLDLNKTSQEFFIKWFHLGKEKCQRSNLVAKLKIRQIWLHLEKKEGAFC